MSGAADEPGGLERIRRVYRAPYYLEVARSGGDWERADEVRERARGASEAEILFMLATTEWRSRRMGAWFAVAAPTSAIRAAVLDSLRTSDGALTAPDLGVAAVVLAPGRALGALRDYQARAIAAEHGKLSDTSALIEHLGGVSTVDPPGDDDRERLRRRLALVATLRS